MFLESLLNLLLHSVALAILAALGYGLGCRLTQNVTYFSVWEEIAVCAGLGLGAIASLIFVLGALHLLYRELVIGVIALLGIICLPVLQEIWRELESLKLSGRLGWAGAISGLVYLASSATLSFYPPFYFTDATSYHLALAKIAVQSHQVAATPYLRYPVFPILNEMLFALSLLVYDDILAQLTQFLMLLLVALTLVAWGHRFFSWRAGLVAGALWLATPLIIWLSGVAGIDIGLTLFLALGIYSFYNWLSAKDNTWLIISGVFMGFAAGSKYSGLIFFGCLGLAALYRSIRERDWRYPVIFWAVGATVAAPWYWFNWRYSGNPVFPFLGEIFGYGGWDPGDIRHQMAELASWGTGRNLFSFLLLPWNLAFNQQPFHLSEAPILPFYVLTLPILVILAIKTVAIRSYVGLCMAYLVTWFFSAQILRYLIPVLPLLCLLTAALFEHALTQMKSLRASAMSNRVLTLCSILLLLYGSFYALNYVRHIGAPPLTLADRETYYENRRVTYDAYRFLNHSRGHDYAVYAVGEFYMAYFTDGTLLGDAFGPARYENIIRTTTGPDLFQQLKSINATHLLTSSQNLYFSNYRPPQDDFFRDHFKLVYAHPYVQLYELGDSSLTPEIGPQLLRNASFEEIQDEQPVEWKSFGSPQIDISGAQSRTGVAGAQSPAALSGYYQIIPIKPGGYYRLGEFTKATGQKQQARLQVQWASAQSEYLGNDIEVVDVGPDWKYFELSVTPPDRAAFASIYVSAHGTSPIWFDDLSFVHVSYSSK